MTNEALIIDLFEAADALANGDNRAMQRLLAPIKNRESYDGTPVLFYVAENIQALEFLAANGVDFLQKNSLGGNNLLHRVSLDSDDPVFEWVLAWYSSNNSVDAASDDGFTVLSTLLKFGRADRAKRLIECGASLSSVANNGLTPARQTVICMEQEHDALEGLALLLSHGLTLGTAELEHMAHMARAINRHRLAKWIEDDLIPSAPAN
ncbi:hypothetical protein LOY37_10990 [Pseudomonas sp. B21-012]|uniref:hypothetical protein n=1 Tax=Pseudomonas sp. B21-012 TaxID=2895472 RepID=UPI00215E2C9E|nr:hypothetical protein [Pseudomonas sp. B21-012]UVM58068.1 hypothetical protein LOY37_10990 [Pseudomonas sp. B21-012]